MQKLSEKLKGENVTYLYGKDIKPLVIIPLDLWTEILKRTASYEREIELEKDMQRRMGLESTLLRRAIEDALVHPKARARILINALRIKR